MMLYHKLTKPNTQIRLLTALAIANIHVLLPMYILFHHLFTESLYQKPSNSDFPGTPASSGYMIDYWFKHREEEVITAP